MPSNPSVRVVVRLPWDRPENPLQDPPPIDWNQEKADILWKYIEKSRSSDRGGVDWKGLATRLNVPLPYLLYRVNARFQEEIRGLQDIQGALSPSGSQPPTKPFEVGPSLEKSPTTTRFPSHLSNSSRFTASGRLRTPLGVRARLSSLGSNSPRPKKESSSSTLTLQVPKKPHVPLRPTTPSSSEGTDSDEEAARKEEDAERDAEEQEALDRKLQQLQTMMTNDALGLVSSPRTQTPKNSLARGRSEPFSPRSMVGSFKQDVSSSSRSASHSVSSASSPQGSIPDIPSPPPESHHHSPMSRRLSASKSSSPPTVSPRSAVGQRYRPLMDRANGEYSSSHGSEASSFSDLSDASLSASALESALMSNIRNGSRLSLYARSRMPGRTL